MSTAVEHAARAGGRRVPRPFAHDGVRIEPTAARGGERAHLLDVARVVRERELVRRRVPPFDVLERVKQLGILAQRARDGAQPPDVLGVTPPGVVAAAVGVRDVARLSSRSSKAARGPLGSRSDRDDEREEDSSRSDASRRAPRVGASHGAGADRARRRATASGASSIATSGARTPRVRAARTPRRRRDATTTRGAPPRPRRRPPCATASVSS